eukprot:TRINITY_DN11621_c0_g1_i1.p1 TRINITY_DN11621_c0_g1~~TRINITY_DN11621_c0_g1_i1.p1  ORF type:complete len:1339 (+),score=313.83 TRINITY_DN11621_c0_g1_i1:75-4019(+)
MTSVDKLLIQGIRSFSPQNRNVIEFYKPLTIIVGPNGAGKTTIIECLKYGTTGDMPPNSKNGQAFLHDPKVAGEREVKAQIKMKFCSASGKPVVCTRSLQLTQKQNRQECKTLESALQTINNAGEKVSQSFRCADIDKEIPELMGVSKAILENVIFCHQEDSNWPLGESSNLKKRFEDIFATTGYTKALDALRKHKKEKLELVKELRYRTESLQKQKEHAKKLRDDVASLRERGKQKKLEILKLQEQVAKAEKGIAEKKRAFEEESRTISEIKEKRAVLASKQSQCEEMFESLQQEFIETDEELEALEVTFNQRVAELETKANELEVIIDKEKKEKRNLELKLEQCRINLQSEKRTLEERVKTLFARDQSILNFAQEHNIVISASLDGFLAPETVILFFKEVEKQELAFEKHKADIKSTGSSKLSEYNNNISNVQQHITAIQVLRAQIEKKILENSSSISDLEKQALEQSRQLSSISSAETQLQVELESLEQLKRLLAEHHSKGQIKAMQEEKQSLKEAITKTSFDLRSLNSEASLRARVEIKRDAFQKAQSQFSLLQSDNEKLRSFLKLASEESHDPVRIKLRLEDVIQGNARMLNTVKTDIQLYNNNVSSIVGQQQTLQENLAKLNAIFEEKQKILQEIEDQRPLPLLIKEAEHTVEKSKKEVAVTKSAELMYKNFGELAIDRHECPLCDRGFEKEEMGAFLGKLKSVLDRVPDSIEETEKKLEIAQTIHSKLLELRPHWEEKARIEQELPDIISRIERLNSEHMNLTTLLQQFNVKLDELKTVESEAAECLRIADQIQNAHQELQKVSLELCEEEERLQLLSTDGRTLLEVETQLKALEAKSDSVEKALESLRQKEHEMKNEINQKESLVNKLQQLLINKQLNEQSVQKIQDSIHNLEASIVSAKEELEGLIQKEKQSQEDLLSKTQLRESVQKEMDEQLASVESEKLLFSQSMHQVNVLHSQVRSGVSAEAQKAKIDELERQCSLLEKEKQTVEDTLNEESAVVEELRKQLQGSEIFRRNILDNIKYRKQKREVALLSTAIEEKEAQARDIRIDQIGFELSEAEQALKAASAKLHTSMGTKSSFKEQIQQILPVLARPEYRDVDEQYQKLLVEAKTTEIAANDLEKYYKALDKALMEFHSLKMDEINKIIKELWQATYKSNDIDTIEIRSEAEPSTSATKARSYNYRVVMVKGDTELDMRGRCSAGQKVLASLIIRLALAETFCINCGILALDEPTTNLDRYNVESLANALVQIIETRKKQSNFQLIVITHDEEFVQLLGRSEYADYYWKVFKDANQHSSIERQDIRELE